MAGRQTYVDRQILQIMPADGWNAIYGNEDGPPFLAPLMGWALVRAQERLSDASNEPQDEPWTEVVGLDARRDSVELVSDGADLLGYLRGAYDALLPAHRWVARENQLFQHRRRQAVAKRTETATRDADDR